MVTQWMPPFIGMFLCFFFFNGPNGFLIKATRESFMFQTLLRFRTCAKKRETDRGHEYIGEEKEKGVSRAGSGSTEAGGGGWRRGRGSS